MTDLEKILKELEKDLDLVDPLIREWNKVYFSDHKDRYKLELKQIERYYCDGKILEIGSVPCHLTHCLKRLKYPVIGLDLEPKRAEAFIKKNKLIVKKCDIENEKMPFNDNHFSLILFFEVLEHLRIDPITTLKEINRVLSPGGIILLSTPNLYSLRTIIRFAMGGGITSPLIQFSKLYSIGHMGHATIYCMRELKILLENTGFKVKREEYTTYNKHTGKIGPFINLFHRVIPSLRTHLWIIAQKESGNFDDE